MIFRRMLWVIILLEDELRLTQKALECFHNLVVMLYPAKAQQRNGKQGKLCHLMQVVVWYHPLSYWSQLSATGDGYCNAKGCYLGRLCDSRCHTCTCTFLVDYFVNRQTLHKHAELHRGHAYIACYSHAIKVPLSGNSRRTFFEQSQFLRHLCVAEVLSSFLYALCFVYLHIIYLSSYIIWLTCHG